MNLKKMMMASALLMVACCMQAQTKVIAHRGFWKTPGSSQNSISSLLKADSIGCYGSEFDVWIAKDNKLVVNHDPVYKMRPMEYSKGDALTGLKLSNGENFFKHFLCGFYFSFVSKNLFFGDESKCFFNV